MTRGEYSNSAARNKQDGNSIAEIYLKCGRGAKFELQGKQFKQRKKSMVFGLLLQLTGRHPSNLMSIEKPKEQLVHNPRHKELIKWLSGLEKDSLIARP